MATIPTLLLLGDSIRIGYQATVAHNLADQANVVGPKENCQHSAFVLQNIDEWLAAFRPDVIHINCGLHDIKVFETGLQVPLVNYKKNLEAIMKTLVAYGATTVWATTTPVIDDWHNRAKDFKRFTSDIKEYNAASVALAEAFSLPTNDMYTFVSHLRLDEVITPDGVHYTEVGYATLGDRVAAFVEPLLQA